MCVFITLGRFLIIQDKFVVGASLLDDELQKQVDCILKMSEDTKLDFAKARHRHTPHPPHREAPAGW